jgi:hypothetical protein
VKSSKVAIGKGERWELQGQQRKLARERKVVPGGSGR